MPDPKPNYQLQAARDEQVWTLEEASAAVGVSAQTFWRWETGLQHPRPYALRKLGTVFGKSPHELGFGDAAAEEEKSEEEPTPVSPPLAAEEEHRDEQTVANGIPSSSPMLTSKQVVVLTGEQAAAFQHLLHLGEDVNTFNQAKRDRLAKMFRTKAGDHQTPTLGQPALLTATLSRRHALAAIVGTTAAALSLSHDIGYPQLHPEEVLLLCASNVPLCWSLYFEGGLAETKEHITPYLSQLSTLVLYPSSYQKQAAALASQTYQLSALLEILFHNLGTALDHAKQAVELASVAEDAHLLTAAHIRQAVVYSNLNRPRQRLTAYEHALRHCESTSPLLQARVYAGLMETHSALGNEKAAFQFLERTNKSVPTLYEADPNFSYTHFDPWSIHMYEKDMYMSLGRVEDAWKTLERSHLVVEQGLTVNRVDLTVKQAETSLMLGNLEQSRNYLISAAQGAASLRSQLLIEGVHDIYMAMRQRWPHEQQVKDLEELFRQ